MKPKYRAVRKVPGRMTAMPLLPKNRKKVVKKPPKKLPFGERSDAFDWTIRQLRRGKTRRLTLMVVGMESPNQGVRRGSRWR